jgi:succinate dehydrogenase / fumarate reductase iron-sulfur subunit
MSPRAVRRRPPAEPVEPAGPVVIVEPVESAPVAPVETVQPEPAGPVETVQPEPAATVVVDSVDSVDSVEPQEAAPVESVEAVEPEPAATVVVEPVESAPVAPTTRFRVSRRKRGDSKPHFDDFDVAVESCSTVLDALLTIRRDQDPSLVVRHSCMHASCGTCGVRVNGREWLACDTPVASLPPGKPVKVEPIAGQRPVADLATDMIDFYARFEAAGLPQVRAAGGPVAAQFGVGVSGTAALDSAHAQSRFENCIECGLCLSACPISRTNRDFIGPAALAAAARVVAEPRGRALGPVLALATEPDSVWRCRSAMECSVVCPAGVEPAVALLELRRHVAVGAVKRIFGRRGGPRGDARP